jgi:hypothetical protein
MQSNRHRRRRNHRGGALAGILIAGFAALIIATYATFATAEDSKESPADRADAARAKTASDDPTDDVKRQRLGLRLIARRYKENKEAFAFGKCRIRYLSNRAATLPDALAGKWKDPPRKDPWEETVSFREDALAWKTEIDQQNFVRKGRFAIDQNGNQAIVYPPKHFRFENSFHPFRLMMDRRYEFSDPASVITSAESTNYEGTELTTQEKVVRDGNEFLLLKHRSTGEGFDADFYIDRRRGYLPFITDYFQKPSGKLHAHKFVLDTRREGTAHFPAHVMLVIYSKAKDGQPYVEVREWKAVVLDLAQPPAADDLTIAVPKRAQFSNKGNPNSAKTIFGGADGDSVTISVEDVEPIYRQLEEVAAGNKRTEPAGAALYAFGWLSNDTRRGIVTFGQFFGRTEAGQLMNLAGNSEIQQELALDAEQKTRLRVFLDDLERNLMAEFQPQGLSRAAIVELYDLNRDERAAKMRAINEKMPALERKFCEKYLPMLRELLTPAQFRRLQEIRWQLGGSRSRDDATIVEAVGITVKQQDKIKAINAEYDERFIDYFATDFSQAPDSDVPIFQEVMTRVSEMARERDASAAAILSQSQREKLQRLQGTPFELGGVRVRSLPKAAPGLPRQ